jgi:quercetin dioxygenase-like cupin family protein
MNILNMVGSLSVVGITSVQPEQSEKGHTTVLRIFANLNGDSHMEELVVATTGGSRSRRALDVPATGMMIREYTPGVVDWHTAPVRQFAVTVNGELEVEVSDGKRRHVRAGELVFLEDTKGKGHITHQIGHVTNLYIQVPDSFDIIAWSHGKS